MAMAATSGTTPPLTIALGIKLRPGPFGGGNQFGNTLQQFLTSRGHTVVHTLTRPNIDVIILTEPRPWSASCAFDITQAVRYCREHPDTKLIHRINECDERKGRTLKLHNLLLRQAAQRADRVVFVSEWIKNLHLANAPELRAKSRVILSGADATTFNPTAGSIWSPLKPLKVITHHWSNNWYKGWDVYQRIDALAGGALKGHLEFTFIGQPWPKARIKHTTILPVMTGRKLATELKRHHVYVSASLNEPAGMHFIEALQCGLPILYRTSGSLPEYCSNYGVPHTGPSDIEAAIKQIMSEYHIHRASLQRLNYTAADMCQQYEQLCYHLIRQSPTTRSQSLYPLKLCQYAVWLHHTASKSSP